MICLIWGVTRCGVPESWSDLELARTWLSQAPQQQSRVRADVDAPFSTVARILRRIKWLPDAIRCVCNKAHIRRFVSAVYERHAQLQVQQPMSTASWLTGNGMVPVGPRG